jgi:translocation and assembly module TamB
LRGAGGGGTLSVTGFATLGLGGGAPHYDFRVRLDQARIEFPVSFTSVLSGSVHLVGTAENGTLNGELGIGQMFVPDNFDLLAWIGRVVDMLAPRPGAAPPFGGKVRLEVQVASEPEVRIESRNLNAVLSVHTRVRGTLADPVGFGEIHVVSGEARLRGNDYKATRGDISLSNPFRTEANVDLEATTRIQHYNLTIDVSGPLENARLAYRSEPPLPTQDILSLLALGYSRAEQSLAVSGSQQSFGTVGASALLSQALSSQVSGRIQRLFGVSQISIDPNVGGPAATSGPRLTLVERPARDFTITYSTNTANSLERVIQVEWDLTDKMSVLGVRDQNGVFGLELRFRRSFR